MIKPFILSAIGAFLVLSCSTFSGAPCVPGTIFARWEYKSCSYKNTSVKGYIEFRRDGTFALSVKARDDVSGRTISGAYPFSIEGNRIVTGYDRGFGMEEYFLIEGDSLFLSKEPIRTAVIPDDPRLGANWSYRLARVK